MKQQIDIELILNKLTAIKTEVEEVAEENRQSAAKIAAKHRVDEMRLKNVLTSLQIIKEHIESHNGSESEKNDR